MSVACSLIDQLHEFESPLVAEAMDAMDCPGIGECYMSRNIRQMTAQSQPMVGIAMLLETDTSSRGGERDNMALIELMESMGDNPTPYAIVMKAIGARPEHECIVGDGMVKIAAAAGCIGFVTDGGIRDLEGIDREGMPVFAAGAATAHSSFMIRRPQGPIEIGGAQVNEGDLLHGDINGLQIIPKACHQGIVEACILSREFETRAHVFGRRSDKTCRQKRKNTQKLYADHQARCRKLLAK